MSFKWYPGKKEELRKQVSRALEMTADAVKTDLIVRQVLPFAEEPTVVAARKTEAAIAAGRTPGAYRSHVVPGELQGSVHVDRSRSERGSVSVVTSTPYARRLYYHPEYNFYQGTNPNAGGMWYEPYKKERKKWLLDTYAAFFSMGRSS